MMLDEEATSTELAVGVVYNTLKDLELAVREYERNICVNFYLRSSRKIESLKKRAPRRTFNESLVYGELDYHCVHGGRKHKPNVKTGSRPNQRTFILGCPASIIIRTTRDGQKLCVKEIKNTHCHDLDKEAYSHHPKQRRIDDDAKEEAKTLLELRVDRRVLQQHLQSKTERVHTLRDIHNLVSRIRSSDQKHTVYLLGKQLAEVASDFGTVKFKRVFKQMSKFLQLLEQGKEASVSEVEESQDPKSPAECPKCQPRVSTASVTMVKVRRARRRSINMKMERSESSRRVKKAVADPSKKRQQSTDVEDRSTMTTGGSIQANATNGAVVGERSRSEPLRKTQQSTDVEERPETTDGSTQTEQTTHAVLAKIRLPDKVPKRGRKRFWADSCRNPPKKE